MTYLSAFASGVISAFDMFPQKKNYKARVLRARETSPGNAYSVVSVQQESVHAVVAFQQESFQTLLTKNLSSELKNQYGKR
ncbi:hypothetical protein P256_00694 [Acinetobacter nectaris CIP 110549]|uniref:Uncharacterized protein n=1 Tax=Acinetobacter nectaris CIP 110549 TaxID=1392540 RepID=V2TRP3_9GAMM|nr:hypothetical protein [Acinetobacter nectaris]ESK40247.1 hypothetical protein P256_00694 [Acinetobacter nectaris CIP 110549]